MPAQNNALENRLSQSSELNLTVTGRKSGRPFTIPVWFVLEDGRLYLLPVHGSDTQWYKNALANPSVHIEAKDVSAEFQATAITDPAEVLSVVQKFRAKYGSNNVKKYYSKIDVAVFAKSAGRG